MSRRDRQYHQSNTMHLRSRHRPLTDIRVIKGCSGVGEKDDFVVAKQGVTRGGVATILGGDAGDNYRVYPQATEDDLQIGAIKGAVATLGDDNLVSLRGDLRIDRDARLTVYQPCSLSDRRPEVFKAAHVATIASVGVGSIDDPDTTLATEGNGTLESGQHGSPGWRLQRGAWCDEVILHVHHDQDSPLRVDPLNTIGHGKGLLSGLPS